MKFILIISVLIYTTLLYSSEETAQTRRLYAYLKIKDTDNGLKEACKAIEQFPTSVPLQEALIRLLAYAGKEMECLQAWKKYECNFTQVELRRDLLETIAWGSIRKGCHSNLLMARLISLVGATITNDAFAVDILKACLKDTNWQIRKLGVDLSSYLMDVQLQREVMRLLQEDPSFEVRLQAVQAVARMQLKEAVPILKKLLSNKELSAEERSMLVEACVMLTEDVEFDEIVSFAKSSRAGLRLLACALVAELKKENFLGPIIPLLTDSHPQVRVGAMNTLGLLRIKEWKGRKVVELIQPCLQDRNFQVAITAAWLATLLEPSCCEKYYTPWLKSRNEDVRRFAAGSLAFTGIYGVDFAYKVMRESPDPFIRLNLAIALVGQRKETLQACREIYTFLTTNNETLMPECASNPLIDVIVPSKAKIESNEVITKEAVDQSTRLELLRMLAILEYPKTMDALKKFLKEKNFGMTGIAASTLIEEGDAEELKLVRALLNDPDQKVRTQAALVIGMWSNDDKEAIRVLQEAYPKADRELKIKILEALGRMGNKESVPFLLNAMQDPFLVIRIIAGSSLIVCLNH